VSQSSEFCRHNPLCCFSASVVVVVVVVVVVYFVIDSVRKLLDISSYMYLQWLVYMYEFVLLEGLGVTGTYLAFLHDSY
jgi:TRAP-type mannitol/chloroaromatic compound transport system permease small subunit